MKPFRVMVAGRWDETDPRLLRIAHEFGRWLASNGYWLVTGGGTGIPRACADGANVMGGTAVEFHPSSRAVAPPGEGYAFTVYTDSSWDGRSLEAVKSSDLLVVLGGQVGTLLEMVIAYQQSVPTVVLRGCGEMIARLDAFLVDGSHLDQRRTGQITLVDSIEACRDTVATAAIAAQRDTP